jgi:hypothetical protein
MRNAHRILVGESEGMKQLGRHRRRWEYNIKMDLKETDLEGVNQIDLVHYMDQRRALVDTVINA